MQNNLKEILKRPINRLTIILVLIVLLPALIYTAYELNSLSENEKIIADIYTQQLDAILFSVNQYTWDYINNWVFEFEQFLIKANLDSLPDALSRNNSIIMLAEIDSSLFHYFTDYVLNSVKWSLTY